LEADDIHLIYNLLCKRACLVLKQYGKCFHAPYFASPLLLSIRMSTSSHARHTASIHEIHPWVPMRRYEPHCTCCIGPPRKKTSSGQARLNCSQGWRFRHAAEFARRRYVPNCPRYVRCDPTLDVGISRSIYLPRRQSIRQRSCTSSKVRVQISVLARYCAISLARWIRG
jgi:hypothetical protein